MSLGQGEKFLVPFLIERNSPHTIPKIYRELPCLIFEVDKAGTYVIKIHDVDVTKRAFKLAIFPHSLVPQQIFLAILGIFIIGSVGYLIWTNQPVLSKKERKVKQDKWDEFMEEN